MEPNQQKEPREVREELPSGKLIIRLFSSDGELVEESHFHGIDMIMSRTFRAGKKIEETFVVNRRLVTRATYEKARVKYPDMPAADFALDDASAPLLKAVAKEARQHRKELAAHTADPARGKQIDAFCTELMAEGESVDATKFLRSKNNTFGELSHSASQKLVTKLLALGSRKIHVCNVEEYPEGMNSGHLVVDLPKDREERKRLFKQLDKLAREQGYSGDLDDGQRYSYVKLD